MEIINVTGGLSGDVFLFKTKDTAIIFDTSAPVDAKNLLENLELVLNGQPLDYIFLTHSHYDHLGGTPYIKEKYPIRKTITLKIDILIIFFVVFVIWEFSFHKSLLLYMPVLFLVSRHPKASSLAPRGAKS